MTTVTWQDRILHIGNVQVDVGAHIEDARVFRSLVLVALDSDSVEFLRQRFPNVRAYDERGRLVWVVELPSDHPEDTYWKTVLGEPISAMSFSSYQCSIDPETGKVIHKEFYK